MSDIAALLEEKFTALWSNYPMRKIHELRKPTGLTLAVRGPNRVAIRVCSCHRHADGWFCRLFEPLAASMGAVSA